MKKIVWYILLGWPLFLAGQPAVCDFDYKYVLNTSNPSYRNFLEQVSDDSHGTDIRPRSVRYIPVIIHVVATSAFQPLSRAQVLQQLDVLNADFAGEGENRNDLPSEFEAIASGVNIQFCLADTDPSGQPSEGMTFTHTDISNIALQTGVGGRMAIHYDQLGGKTGWDPETYLNIWVGEYGDILGSASFPGMAPYTEEIGVVIDIRHFGSIGDAGASGFYGRGHTLTHEMGHFFGLKHIWGQGLDYICEDSDDIDDTPNASGPYYNCPSGVQRSCDASNMYQNFMDLTDDRCLAAFTRDQAAKMESVLASYYPFLSSADGCHQATAPFDAWYDALYWSYDAISKSVVIYSELLITGSNKSVRVYSADGRILHSGIWENQWSYQIPLNNAGVGVYFVQISDGSHKEVYKIPVY